MEPRPKRAKVVLKKLWVGRSNLESLDNPPAMTERTDEQRKEIMTRYVTKEVARGGRVELHSDFDTVLSFGKRPNHILHLLLSLITGGIWLIVWVLIVVGGGVSRTSYHVDRYGWISAT